MESKDDILLDKTLKLAQVEAFCNKHLYRCPASAAQASMKSMAMTILKMIKEDEFNER